MGRPAVKPLLTILLLAGSHGIFAQGVASSAASAPPAAAPTPGNQLIASYTLSVDSTDVTGYDVSIQVYFAPKEFRLAMATHNEYDDRFRRNIRNFKVWPPASFERKDSGVWSITSPANHVNISYRVQLPPQSPVHFSHRPFLTTSGGLVGDLHSFMYPVGYENTPCAVTFQLPFAWSLAGGIDPMPPPAPTEPPRELITMDPATGQAWYPQYFRAVSIASLLDAPILIGHLHRWSFGVEDTRHEIVYLPSTPAVSLDSVALVGNIDKIVRAAHDIFGAFPYQHYTFLIEDAGAGALEHASSVTIGATPADLANPARSGIYEEIAHEFFHAWNGLSIQPPGYTPLHYGPQQQSTGLWFSEGVTMFYADLIARRCGLPVEDPTRLSHLTRLITRYYSDTGNTVLPPAKVSLADFVQPGPLGNYSASTHLQGELLGACLDLLIRDATDGRRSLDDLMRAVFRQYGNKQPVTDSALETATAAICQCDAAHNFFRNYLGQGNTIGFAQYLRLIGIRIRHDQPMATDSDNRPLPDLRVYSYILRDDTSLRIGITNPNGCWARAGLNSGDIITAINNRPMHSRQEFAAALHSLHVGDTAQATIKKETGTSTVPVYITGYTIPLITITTNPAATAKQRRLFDQWAASAPLR